MRLALHLPSWAGAEDTRFELVRGCHQHAFQMFAWGPDKITSVLTCGQMARPPSLGRFRTAVNATTTETMEQPRPRPVDLPASAHSSSRSGRHACMSPSKSPLRTSRRAVAYPTSMASVINCCSLVGAYKRSAPAPEHRLAAAWLAARACSPGTVAMWRSVMTCATFSISSCEVEVMAASIRILAMAGNAASRDKQADPRSRSC